MLVVIDFIYILNAQSVCVYVLCAACTVSIFIFPPDKQEAKIWFILITILIANSNLQQY